MLTCTLGCHSWQVGERDCCFPGLNAGETKSKHSVDYEAMVVMQAQNLVFMLTMQPVNTSLCLWPLSAVSSLMTRSLAKGTEGSPSPGLSVKLGAQCWKVDHTQAVAIVTHHCVRSAMHLVNSHTRVAWSQHDHLHCFTLV